MTYKTYSLFLLIAIFISTPSATAQPRFKIVKVSKGVYAAIRTEPPGLTVNANSVFIINDSDVVVVDTTLTPGTARETIAALRQLTNKPVKYVINTHWHDDHIMGNQAYRDAFPGVEFIGHVKMSEYLPTTGLANRQGAMSEQGYPGFIKALTTRLEKNESIFGGPMDQEERDAYQSSAEIAERYMAENPKVEIILPSTTVEDRLTLQRGERTIDIRYFGRGHTSADLVVYLPKERIAITGDLVVWPVPYVGSPQSHPGDWSKTLDQILMLHPKMIVPGHGPVLTDDSQVKEMSKLFLTIDEQVRAAVKRGETLDQIHKNLNLDSFRDYFAGNSRIRKLIFRNYVAGPAVDAAYLDATAKQ
ncbi:MAG TPA: MBL fold metallo-hydrolase [Pyrinomonadaceae bacterium]|jgi:glyoxylase-like metal-dependent hydrolase (beta-lactamase superfamily II)|nr:MBL fold metallo-hydrolase [Pyrinomonadaceae bacterium]